MVTLVTNGYILPFFRNLTVNEILDLLDESDDEDIYIDTPYTHELTDEDSADSEDENIHVPSPLNGRQLLASAEIQQRNDEDISDNEDVPSARKQKIVHKFDWKKSITVELGCSIFPEANLTRYKDFSPRDFFELFFDDEVFDHIVNQSNLYALQKNLRDIAVTKDELKVFFAIMIISGYAYSSSKADYWSNGEDLRNHAIYNSMRRNRFDQIMRAIHFQDNLNLDYQEKYSKIRPLITFMQRRFMEHYIPSEIISHNEAMVEYFGKHGCKQSIRNKSIRFGYKIWSQNFPSGYLINFEPYQGKGSNYEATLEINKFGHCAATMFRLLSQYNDEKKTFAIHDVL